MNFRGEIVAVLGLLVLLSGLAVPTSSAAPATDEVLARVHWLGLKQISADTNAAPLMKVWQLPPTIALVAQTFDKLSRGPGHGATNATGALLRPLLDDLVSSEFYLELSALTNFSLSAGGEVGLGHFKLFQALPLSADRARLWQTNLAAIPAVLTGGSAATQRIECSRAGDWTLVGVGLDKNILQTKFAARLPHPRPSSATNLWLEADLNPSRLADCFSLSARRTGGEGRGEVGIFPPSTPSCQLSTRCISPSPARPAMSSPVEFWISPIRWKHRCRRGRCPPISFTIR